MPDWKQSLTALLVLIVVGVALVLIINALLYLGERWL